MRKKNCDTLRMFVAIEIAQPIIERAQQLIARLAEIGATVSWVRPNNMHLTLKFGEAVQDVKRQEVVDIVAETAARHEPFQIRFARAGAFPRVQRPQILWLGVEDSGDGLAKLHRDLERGLARLGFAKEPRGYHPHLTLGRLRSSSRESMLALANALQREAAFVAGEQMVHELVVFSSELTSAGPVYTALARAVLGIGE